MFVVFTFKNKTRTRIHPAKFRAISAAILGPDYELSVVCIGDVHMRHLNKTYRNKDTTTDILSFSLGKRSGEIFISPRTAAKKSAHFGMTVNAYHAYLMIHGCVHLKGMDHGPRMDRHEKKWARVFGISLPPQKDEKNSTGKTMG